MRLPVICCWATALVSWPRKRLFDTQRFYVNVMHSVSRLYGRSLHAGWMAVVS
jgi:hypothetical protein